MGSKKVVFSAVQPSGALTIGNYFGAIKNWIKMQEEYNCIFALADLHTITVRQNPEEFKKNIIELYALLLACGVNPEKSNFFVQSHVHSHCELAWILSCYTQFGELSRMTQFKDKSSKYSENVNVGLFSYPVLMASDILLYSAELIPVGEDQKQHVELTRDIAQRFNGVYGETFVVPEAFVPKTAARIMSLQNPQIKMSKSSENPNSCVFLLDSIDDILKKFKRAVTDSNSQVKYTQGTKTGINNLMSIYSACTDKSFLEIENEFEGQGYGKFKTTVAEAVVEIIRPIQEKFKKYLSDYGYLESMYKEGAKKAYEISEKKLKEVKEKIGFIL